MAGTDRPFLFVAKPVSQTATLRGAMSSRIRPLNRAEASNYLHEKHGIRRSPATLAKAACIGGGPAFRKAGRIPLYDPPDLDEWAGEITSALVRSTSELMHREPGRSRSPFPRVETALSEKMANDATLANDGSATKPNPTALAAHPANMKKPTFDIS
jgi:hypothetical protein